MAQVASALLSAVALTACAVGSTAASLPVSSIPAQVSGESSQALFPDARPPVAKRKFSSSYVEKTIAWMEANLLDTGLAELFRNCFPNTLDTTVTDPGSNSTCVITGDIDAMWLRDSMNQVMPYLPLVPFDEALNEMVHGLIHRQLVYVLHDSFANAFNADPNGHGHQTDERKPPMTPLVFEGKYELDSLCSVLKLTSAFAQAHGQDHNVSWLVNNFPQHYELAVEMILTTMQSMQVSTAEQEQNASLRVYEFVRPAEGDVYPRRPAGRTGMVRSAFRPSDDQTYYDFLVPSNLMAAVELGKLLNLSSSAAARGVGNWTRLHAQASTLRAEICAAVKAFALTEEGYLAYETDGLGNFNLMDDANLPSLLSLPFLGVTSADILDFETVYEKTRAFVLSVANPYFYSGPLATGVGSPHTSPHFVWPLALMAQTATAKSDAEILSLLAMLKSSAIGTGLMHESFSVHDASNFTRSWFAWGNTLFGQTLLQIAHQRPELLLKRDHAQFPPWFPRPFL